MDCTIKLDQYKSLYQTVIVLSGFTSEYIGVYIYNSPLPFTSESAILPPMKTSVILETSSLS